MKSNLTQQQTQMQTLRLTVSMRQALKILQFSTVELMEHVKDVALSNPLLEIETLDTWGMEEPYAGGRKSEEARRWDDAKNEDFFENFAQERRQSLTEYLSEQLRESSLVKGKFLALCLYLVECLDERGYLTIPIDEIADETGCGRGEVEQALFALHMLEPTGVGARNLQECLILQLSQGRNFNGLTLRLAREELSLLASRDYEKLSRKLRVSVSKIRDAANVIAELNPIPSRGFFSGETVHCSLPDAWISVENGAIFIQLGGNAVMRVSVREDYVALLQGENSHETQAYLREKLSEANALLDGMEKREKTMRALLEALVAYQSEYFLAGGEKKPLTMRQMADMLGVSASTVSRAVQGKVIVFDGRNLPLRSFFTAAALAGEGENLSNENVKKRIAYLIAHEEAGKPLPDEAIRLALESSGVRISRRTVAKYRKEMEIPSAARRR